MKLRLKLPLAFAALLCVVLVAAGGGLWALNRAIDTYRHEVQTHQAQERAVGGIAVAFKLQVQEWKNTLLRGRKPAELAKHWQAFQRTEADVQARTRALLAELPAGTARERLQGFADAHATMGAQYRKGYAAFEAAGFDPATGDQAVAGMDRAPAKLLDEAGERIAAERESASDAAAVQAATATRWSAWLMALVGGAGIAIGVLFSLRITRPLARAVAVAQAVAGGDLALMPPAEGRDELADLLRALRSMQESLAGVVRGVQTGAEAVAAASAQIARGNLDLSQRTERQAAALQQTAASMAQLDDTVGQNADHAREASTLARDAAEVAQRGGEVVGHCVQTMQGIADGARRIHDITGLIDALAFQTNLLALNAAVEAARAGEQGRGFAVVAGEVRTLAQRSADAARQIKALIADSSAQAEQGNTLVGQAGRTIAEAVAAITRVNEVVERISLASQEQRSGVGQVGAAVGQIDQATQQNAALVEESAAAAESLREQAHKLMREIGTFRLPGTAPRPA